MAGIEQIREVEELDTLLERSHERPVVIFKHSVTCGISAGARRRYEAYVESAEGKEVDFTLLEVQTARTLSNQIAETMGIRHQSPQAILLRGGEAVWNSSHGSITESSLDEALRDGGAAEVAS